jgi:hypothetical protein
LQSSLTSDPAVSRLIRALTDVYSLAVAIVAGIAAAVFQWPWPLAGLVFVLVMAVRVGAEYLVPRGARLELADTLSARSLQIRSALTGVESLARRGAPVEVADRVAAISLVIQEITDRQTTLAGSSPQLFAVLRTATDYLPTAIEAYLRLPQGYARSRPLADGRTALEVLLGQLNLLEKEMVDVADAVTQNDINRLLAHERFLTERFGRSALTLPGSG